MTSDILGPQETRGSAMYPLGTVKCLLLTNLWYFPSLFHTLGNIHITHSDNFQAMPYNLCKPLELKSAWLVLRLSLHILRTVAMKYRLLTCSAR
jgi:hypothetical protein